MRVADYVVEFLVERGIQDVFLVSGGGIMHLTDAVGLNPKIRYYCNYHEQAAVVAAERYARVRGRNGAISSKGQEVWETMHQFDDEREVVEKSGVVAEKGGE